ncbi:hypothetical protein [Streptomyces acidicola]|uniref:hypothetical protein n=1 Tax=Streptomyces acidicola TaxID=2596892 RepID=UPI003812222B
MTEVLIAAFSALVAAGALTVSYEVYRHQVRQAAVLATRESRIEARERQLWEREQEADRRESRGRASMIAVRALAAPSSLHTQGRRVLLDIANHSNRWAGSADGRNGCDRRSSRSASGDRPRWAAAAQARADLRGADEFSVRYIDRVENQEAGRRLNGWYDNDRILNQRRLHTRHRRLTGTPVRE